MKKVIFYFIITLLFLGCNKVEEIEKPKVENNEKILLERKEIKNNEERLLNERNEKYSNMISENRESGDIAGIWKITNDNIYKINEFLNLELKSLSGYCIEVSSDLMKARLYFTSTDKIFDVSIKQLSDIRYEMKFGDKTRIFEVVNLPHSLYKNSRDLIWFFEDSHKYNSKKGSEQLQDGYNFYDYCTKNIYYDCTVEGCLKDIKERDAYGKAEKDAGPLGIEDEINSDRKN